jgi:hypothetical protein
MKECNAERRLTKTSRLGAFAGNFRRRCGLFLRTLSSVVGLFGRDEIFRALFLLQACLCFFRHGGFVISSPLVSH